MEQNKMQIKALNIALMAICAALYTVVGILTSFGLNFGGVAFWPAAFIPAIFAVLFGPWEGAVGAAIGIFLRDSYINGQPLLSLCVGVPANFAAFFLMGYFAHKKFDTKKTIISLVIGFGVILAGLILPTLIYPAEFTGLAIGATTLSATTVELVFAVLMFVSFAIFLGISRFIKDFRSFSIGSMIGMSVGAFIIAFGVWGFSQLVFGANQYFAAPLSGPLASAVFVWTFVTEAPFVLLLSPPVIKAAKQAFPFLRKEKVGKETTDTKIN
jgi:uncharacterized membrane protein